MGWDDLGDVLFIFFFPPCLMRRFVRGSLGLGLGDCHILFRLLFACFALEMLLRYLSLDEICSPYKVPTQVLRCAVGWDGFTIPCAIMRGFTLALGYSFQLYDSR